MKRLKASEVATCRQILLKKQEYKCPLCTGKMQTNAKKKPVLDHDHGTGFIRDVLCANCNGIEGKVFNLARRAKNTLAYHIWVSNLLAYWERHETSQHDGLLHPTHKTAEEKRLARNAKARKRRAAAKSQE